MAGWAGRRYYEFKLLVLEKHKAVDGKVKCNICKEMIDLSLPGTVNAGFTIDHILPKELYPDLILEPSNHQPAHNICNKKKSTKNMSQVEASWLAGNAENGNY